MVRHQHDHQKSWIESAIITIRAATPPAAIAIVIAAEYRAIVVVRGAVYGDCLGSVRTPAFILVKACAFSYRANFAFAVVKRFSGCLAVLISCVGVLAE